jgi:hypothetical protein
LGGPSVEALPSAWVIWNPPSVTLMHCVALVPQALFCTTYLSWMVVVPNWSQICSCAWEVCVAVTKAAIDATATRTATAAERMRDVMRLLLMWGKCGGMMRCISGGSAPKANSRRTLWARAADGKTRRAARSAARG